MSHITFELYGRLRKLADAPEYRLTLSTPVSLAVALEQLASLQPQLADQLENCACAIADELIARNSVLEANARIALLPPVAGG